MILFALVSAAAPEYMWLFFIIYFAIIMIVMSKMTMSGLKRVDQMKGSPIFKEENAATVMASDAMLIQEVKEQFKSPMLLLLLSFALIFVIPPIYWGYVSPYVESLINQMTTSEFIVRFVVFLAFYVFMIAILYVPRALLMRGVKQKKQLYYPRVYAVYKEGIVIEGRLLQYSKDMCFKS
jgi:Predicted membrane protein